MFGRLCRYRPHVYGFGVRDSTIELITYFTSVGNLTSASTLSIISSILKEVKNLVIAAVIIASVAITAFSFSEAKLVTAKLAIFANTTSAKACSAYPLTSSKLSYCVLLYPLYLLKLEPCKRIELLSSGWKPVIIPLY